MIGLTLIQVGEPGGIWCRVPNVRLISCILESNKGIDKDKDKDFLIISGE